ncbi:hypothetical protein ACP26F_10375 [Franconibacter pulveris 1160]|uniref:Uncharacterized protein n=1 Tax=Franconibacter daqui TaxID=2047724 RepID=A0ABV1PH64_9ENTR|nr:MULTISPECIES: hypothetical protein [Franconibacter]MEB5920591.1 hypothetical protein [Franconibacter daqui]GGD15665.1 hypothetical protein GCM10011513_11320 [Franconibacter daqui]
MKIITVTPDHTRQPTLVEQDVLTTHMKLGDSQIVLRYRKLPALIMPVLDVEFYDKKGKRYSLRYNLPPDTAERTGRRVSLLLYLLDKRFIQNTMTDPGE